MFLLVPAYLGSPGEKAVKRLCACVRACVRAFVHACVRSFVRGPSNKITSGSTGGGE